MNKQTNRIILGLIFLSLGLFLYLLAPNWTIIVLAAITAYFAQPLYHWIVRKTKKKSLWLLGTWIGIVLCIIIPLVIITGLLISQIGHMYHDLSSSDALDNALTRVQDHINVDTLTDLEDNFGITTEKIKTDILAAGQKIIASLTNRLISFGTSFVSLFTSLIIYIIVVSAILTRKKSLRQEIKDIVPIDDSIIDLYMTRLTLMGRSMILATFAIAAIQGVVTGLSLRITGIPYVVFFTFVAMLFAIIPMIGASFVATPIAIVMALSGNFVEGLIVFLINQVIVNNIDNVLRPKLVDDKAKINETLLILSVFGGLVYRGILGIIYGPVIMIFILTTIEVAKEKKILH